MPRHGGGGADTPRSPLRIAHDGEFFARLLTKESSHGNPSFRYYYGAGPGAVPFVWESHPGTPKDPAHYSSSDSAAVVPAITPPPSYHLRAAAGAGAGPNGHSSRRHGKHGAGSKVKYCGYKKLNKWIKIGFIATVFRRLAFGSGKSSSRSSSSSPTAASVKSSSTRWLFSGSGAAESRNDLQEYSCYEPAPAPTTTTKGTLCSLGGVRPSPWMLQFWGGGRREHAGWAYA